MTKFPRRTFLSAGAIGIGGASFALTGGVRATMSPPRIEHTTSFQIQQDGEEIDLIVNWAEFYNGQLVEDQPEASDRTDDEPIVTLSNVMPGDSGLLHFGLQLGPSTTVAARPMMRLRAHAYDENGQNEPEEKTGDTTLNVGELQEYVEVTVWYDTGDMMDNPCNGVRGPGEQVIEQGTFATVAAAMDDWITLDAKPGQVEDCLLPSVPDDELCLGIEWALPADLPSVDDNVVQGDSIDFEIGFRVEEC